MAASRRLKREKRTVDLMIRMHCSARHGVSSRLCADCESLLGYALGRVDACPFGGRKPTCAQCRVHCYRTEQRERIREAMRYSGPRMMGRHPYLAIMHLADGRRFRPKGPPADGSDERTEGRAR